MNGLATAGAAELEAAFRQGYEAGLTALDQRFRPLLLRFIKRVCGGALALEDLIDCYQETFLHLTRLTRREDFDPEEPLRLVFTVARRKAIDALRRRDRLRSIQLSDASLQAVKRSSLGNEEKAELVAVICEAVDALPRQQRLVARSVVRCIENLEQRRKYSLVTEDILERTGQLISPSAAKSAWLKARQSLRSALARKGFGVEGESR